MKKTVSNIAVFFLTALLLFLSASFTIEKHFCEGQVFSESFFGNADKCVMDVACCKAESNNPSISKKSCCEDEIQFIRGSVFKKETAIKIERKQQQDLPVLVLLDVNSIFNKPNRIALYKNYFPPPITPNFNILYQVFRI